MGKPDFMILARSPVVLVLTLMNLDFNSSLFPLKTPPANIRMVCCPWGEIIIVTAKPRLKFNLYLLKSGVKFSYI